MWNKTAWEMDMLSVLCCAYFFISFGVGLSLLGFCCGCMLCFRLLTRWVFFAERKLTAGHDISDGGLVTCVLEMAFAGNCGLRVDIASSDQASGDASDNAGQLAVTAVMKLEKSRMGRK